MMYIYLVFMLVNSGGVLDLFVADHSRVSPWDSLCSMDPHQVNLIFCKHPHIFSLSQSPPACV